MSQLSGIFARYFQIGRVSAYLDLIGPSNLTEFTDMDLAEEGFTLQWSKYAPPHGIG